MDNEMIERCTKAAYEKAMIELLGLCEPTWENLSSIHKTHMIDIQIAAIKAMREPTEQIKQMATSKPYLLDLWKIMIDAIIGDK